MRSKGTRLVGGEGLGHESVLWPSEQEPCAIRDHTEAGVRGEPQRGALQVAVEHRDDRHLWDGRQAGGQAGRCESHERGAGVCRPGARLAGWARPAHLALSLSLSEGRVWVRVKVGVGG